MAVTITIHDGSAISVKNGAIIITPSAVMPTTAAATTASTTAPVPTPTQTQPQPKHAYAGLKLDQACDVIQEAFSGHSIVHRSVIALAGKRHGISTGNLFRARQRMGITIKDCHWIWPNN
jgi:hypothetical protein